MPTPTPLQNGGCRTYQLLALGLLVERLVRNLRLLPNTLHLGVRLALDLRMQLAILRTLQRKKGAPGQGRAGPASDRVCGGAHLLLELGHLRQQSVHLGQGSVTLDAVCARGPACVLASMCPTTPSACKDTYVVLGPLALVLDELLL